MPPEARLPLTSLSPDADRLAGLKALFPEAFTEGKIDFDRLKQVLGGQVQTDRERYGLNWAGKTSAIHVLQSLSVGTLKPDREASVNFDTTENLIIEGDNLEVLKLLQKSYFGQVKMIYIDPPYNTGNEFIYPDNFREGLEDYLRFSGQMSAEGTAATSNKETDGRYHSKWLSMMYPRLFLAKNLLRDDGVIFISIDDNELHNLRLMMNEIFGEENFVAQFVWQSRQSVQNDTDISVNHEYIVSYAKMRRANDRRLKESNAASWLTSPGFAAMPLSLDQRRYSNPDNDPRGPWKADPFDAPNVRANLAYPIVNPNTGETFFPPVGRHWRTEEATYKNLQADNRIIFGKNGTSRPQLKVFLTEREAYGEVENTWFSGDRLGTTTHGTQALMEIFAGGVFDNPKPITLIIKLIRLAMQNGGIVLDFFAGSGTTAQAVLELNKEDGGNRKFILVQLPEKTENKQFPTIADITRERVRRVIQKMNAADAGKLPLSDAAPDRGFKAFQLSASNFKIWEGTEGEEDADAIAAQLELFADNLLPDATPENILFEILLKAGYDLNVPCEEISIGGHSVYSIADGQHLICLERDITREAVDGMIERKPAGVICLDEAFHGDDALLTNTLLQMQDAEIIFQTI